METERRFVDSAQTFVDTAQMIVVFLMLNVVINIVLALITNDEGYFYSVLFVFLSTSTLEVLLLDINHNLETLKRTLI